MHAEAFRRIFFGGSFECACLDAWKSVVPAGLTQNEILVTAKAKWENTTCHVARFKESKCSFGCGKCAIAAPIECQ